MRQTLHGAKLKVHPNVNGKEGKGEDGVRERQNPDAP
jgi:hypothetical protein